MAIINKTGIGNGNTIQAEHVTRIIDTLTNSTGSHVTVSGSFTGAATLTSATITSATITGGTATLSSATINGTLINGQSNTSGGSYSHAEGGATTSTGQYSHAEGQSTIALNLASHAEGYSTNANGNYSHAEGYQTFTTGQSAHAEGYRTSGSNDYSHAEGGVTTAANVYAHSEGYQTRASGISAHSEGYLTTGSGNYSHAEGAITTASGSYTHAEGVATTARGDYSHAEGGYTNSIGSYSHAEGQYTRAIGDGSHAEGLNTTASGNYSHAEGTNSITVVDYSHAEGIFTIASGSGQHVSGKYNKHGDSTSLTIIGDGTNDASRSDIFKTKVGAVEISGSLNILSRGATSATDAVTITNSSGINLLTVQNDGNVGIATSAPEADLDIRSTNADGRVLSVSSGGVAPDFSYSGSIVSTMPNTRGQHINLIRRGERGHSIGYLPGTNKFMISRGREDGDSNWSSEYLDWGGFVQDNGLHGFNTNSPSASLHVNRSDVLNTPGARPTGNWAAIIENRRDQSSHNGLSVVNRWGGPESIIFEVASSWSGSLPETYTPVMTVLGNRRVGIGTTTPSSSLHIKGNGGNLTLEGTDHVYMAFHPDGYNASLPDGNRKAFIGFANTTEDWLTVAGESANKGVALKAGGYVRQYVDPNGRISFGTSDTATPSHSIELQQQFGISPNADDYTDIVQNMYWDNNAPAGWRSRQGGPGSLFRMYGGTNQSGSIEFTVFGAPPNTAFGTLIQPTQSLWVDANSYVGIGSQWSSSPGGTRPDAPLHVVGSAGVGSNQGGTVDNVGIKVDATYNYNQGVALLLGSKNGNTPFIAAENTGSILFITSNTSRIKIDGWTGNVGIGTESPSSPLEIVGGRPGAKGGALLISSGAGADTAYAGAIVTTLDSTHNQHINIIKEGIHPHSLGYVSGTDKFMIAISTGSDADSTQWSAEQGRGGFVQDLYRHGFNMNSPSHSIHVDKIFGVSGNTGGSYTDITNNSFWNGVTNNWSSSLGGPGSLFRMYGGPMSVAGFNFYTTMNSTADPIQAGHSYYSRLFISASGYIGIGTESPTHQLTLSTDSAYKPSSGTWAFSSDSRLKENIEEANYDTCYDIIKNLPLKRYTWKPDVYTIEQVADRSKLGWIAQDVQTIFPKAVTSSSFSGSGDFHLDDCLSMNADQIYAVMYGTIKKLIVENESLKSELHTIKTHLGL